MMIERRSNHFFIDELANDVLEFYALKRSIRSVLVLLPVMLTNLPECRMGKQ
jgi:hypothetical protein